jgi:hypothetical protein
VTPLERRCGWLLLAYPAWYRRKRSGEMLGTLLEASPPGRSWPSFRDTRALIAGGLRVRGRAWLLSILWVGLGAAESGYVFLVSTQPPAFPNNFQVATWVGEPGLITGAGELAGVAWLVLTIPVLVAGLIRLRGWRPGQGLRAAAWAGAWAAGFALMVTVEVWQAPATCGEYGCPPIDHAVVSWIELPICAAFLALGAAMTRILAVPAHGWDVPDTSSRSSRKASLRAPGAGDLQP